MQLYPQVTRLRRPIGARIHQGQEYLGQQRRTFAPKRGLQGHFSGWPVTSPKLAAALRQAGLIGGSPHIGALGKVYRKQQVALIGGRWFAPKTRPHQSQRAQV